MSKILTTSVILIIVLACIAVSIAMAEEGRASRDCQKIDEQAGIALDRCSWMETGKWFLEVTAINNSNDDKNFGIKCSPMTPEKISKSLSQWRFDASPGSTFRFSFVFDSTYERPELTCELSDVMDGYFDDESSNDSYTDVYEDPIPYEQTFKEMWERWGGPPDQVPKPGELSKPSN